MIKFIDNYFQASDARGSIVGLINFGAWEEFNLIRSEPGVVRGGHFHAHTEEGFVILKGTIDILLQEISDGSLAGAVCRCTVTVGQVFIIPPMICHTFTATEAAEWINFLSHRIDPAAPDILRPEPCSSSTTIS